MTCNTEKTHWKKVVSDPNYIGEGDFQPGQEIVVTIDRVVSHETVPTAEGKSDKAVIYFKEKYKPMILNVARSKSITKVAGSPYFEDWIGVRIQLYVEHGIRAFGEVVSAVRVRPFKPRVALQQDYKCQKCGKTVQAFGKMNAEQMAKYTKDKYGEILCSECATEKAAVKENTEEDPVKKEEE